MKYQALIPIESRLEGVDRRNLKITNLSTHYKSGLALELMSSPRERNLVPVEVVTKTGSLSTLSLSQTVT
jgi:hypothetical protein